MTTKKAPSIKKSKGEGIYLADERSSLCISEKELQAIKDWKIGEKYTLEVEVEMTGIRKKDYGTDQGKLQADFKINKISAEDED